jgi:hypothetical protein
MIWYVVAGVCVAGVVKLWGTNSEAFWFGLFWPLTVVGAVLFVVVGLVHKPETAAEAAARGRAEAAARLARRVDLSRSTVFPCGPVPQESQRGRIMPPPLSRRSHDVH